MKYIAYARRSSTDKKKQLQSIPIQLQWIEETAEKLGVEVLQVFIDKQTGTKTGRQGFTEMMGFIDSSKESLGILSWKISRLARNPIDEGYIKQGIIDGKIKHIYTSDREFRENANQILLGVEFGAATQSSIELGRSVRFGLNRKADLGYRPTLAPLGYLNDPYSLKGQKKIHKDPERFRLLKWAWKKFLTGAYSVPAIIKALNKKGFTTRAGKGVSKTTLYRIFANPFYAGYYYWHGELLKGKHPPMVALDDFDRVQELLAGTGRVKGAKREHVYGGLFSCGECGYAITTETHKKKIKKTGSIKEYVYLHCTHKNPNIDCKQGYNKQEIIESQILTVLTELDVPQPFVDWFFDCLRHRYKEVRQSFTKKREALQKEYDANESMIETLIDNLNKKVIDNMQYEKTLKRYQQRAATIKKSLANYEKLKDDWIDTAYKDFCFARVAGKVFSTGDKNTKREIISQIGLNWIIQDGELLVELYPQYKVLQGVHNAMRLKSPLFEPPLCRPGTTKNASLYAQSPIWGG